MIDLKLKISNLPLLPGCYLMKDKHQNIIYVGKAKQLKKRVAQYFVGVHDYKTQRLVANISDFDFIVTNSEKEALLLEINLIKLHRPRFNIMFMDDKTYPYIKVDPNNFLHLSVVREKEKDKKSNYYGPYPNVMAAYEVLNLLNTLYPLRKCQPLKKKVCLYYHLKQCLAPCQYEIDEKIAQYYFKQVTLVLNGKIDAILTDLEFKMNEYSQNLLFEKASVVKNQIVSLKQITSQQNVMGFATNLKIDIFNYYEADGFISICVLIIRKGILLDKINRIYPLTTSPEENVTTFILQYYQDKDFSDEMIVPQGLDISLLKLIDEHFVFKKRGRPKVLLDNAYLNAKEYLANQLTSIKHQQLVNDQGFDYLSNILNLSNIHIIDMLDVSHIAGYSVGGVSVRNELGVFNKKLYRTYSLDNINNDPLSMANLLQQHLNHLLKHDFELPDILMIDGGVDQVKMVSDVLKKFDLTITVIGVVKDSFHNSDHLLYNGREYSLDRNSYLYFFLANIQDEVHRFALKFHKKLRNKKIVKSYLDSAPLIGNKRKKMILDKYLTLEIAKKQPLDAYVQLLGPKIGQKFYEWLQRHEDE